MNDYTGWQQHAFWRDSHYWWVIGGAVLLTLFGMLLWNTAYSSGHSDGVRQMLCVQQADAQRLQGMTEKQQADYLDSGVYTFPSQCR